MNKKNSKLLSRGDAFELSVLENGVALLKFDLAGSKVNKLSNSVMSELDCALDRLAAEPGVRGLVIYSGKEEIFIAGADLDEVAKIQKMSPVVAYEATQRGKAVFAKLAKLPYRTVAAVHGACLGGGTELILACSHRLASDSPKTKFGLPEVGLGFIPGWGGTVRLPKLIGAQAALEMILQPLKNWDSEKSWRRGLVSEVLPQEKLLERAIAVAAGASPRQARQSLKDKAMRLALEKSWPGLVLVSIAGALLGAAVGGLLGAAAGYFFSSVAAAACSGAGWLASILALAGLAYAWLAQPGPSMLRKGATGQVLKETKGNYPAPLAAIKVVMAALSQDEQRAFELESNVFAGLCVGPVSQNLVRLFHLTQAGKKSNARLPKKVGVLGCGVMGAGIVQIAAYSGFKVVARDPYPGAIEKGQATVKGLFDKLVEKKILSRDEADRLFANISFVKDEMAPLADCDLVIEAVIEDVKAKQAAYLELEKVLSPEAIIATNTSSLSVSELGSCLADPARFGGLHFFNPVHAMKFVEVIKGAKTSEATADVLQAFAAKLGKITRPFGDSAGFAVNRILAPYMFEAMKLLEEGVPAEDIEKAMTKFGMPMGPLALMDEVGLDICANVVRVMNKALGARVSPTALMGRIKELKLLGKKGGKGIYLYDEKGKQKGFNPELLASVSATPVKKKIEEIQDRMVLAMVRESVLCMEEGIASEADDLNLAMILATGWSPFRGGPLRYADALGARALEQKLALLYQATGDKNYAPARLLAAKAQSGKSFCG